MISSTEQLTEREARQVVRSVVRHRLRALGLVGIYVLLFGAYCVAVHDTAVALGIWIGALLGAVVIGYRFAVQARFLARIIAMPTQVTVTPEFLAFERPVGGSRIRLDLLDRCVDTRRFWMLSGKVTARLVLPKGVFTPTDQARVTELLTAGVAGRRRWGSAVPEPLPPEGVPTGFP